jgi:transposase, IS6 family
MTPRPAIFKWRQTEPQLILCAVRWYLRYSLSLPDVEELLGERCLEADHTTVWRWAGGNDVRCQIPFIDKLFGLAA